MNNRKSIAYIIARQSEIIFAQEMRATAQEIKQELIPKVREKMREDRGAEKRNVKGRVSGSGYRLTLEIYGTLPQTFVDERGRKPGGKLPPYKKGSKLYDWTRRKMPVQSEGVKRSRRLAFASDVNSRRRFVGSSEQRTKTQSVVALQESVSFLVARSIARRGIKPQKPFERTARENTGLVSKALSNSIARASRRLKNL